MEITPWISIAESHQPGRRISSTRDGLPIEVAIRDRVRGFIESLVEAELDEALGRSRYQRPGTADQAGRIAGSRHGRRERQLLGSFGPVTISVPRARLSNADGASREWHSEALPRYARMTKQVEALIAGAYLSGTNTRRVRRALGALFKGAVSKDTVSRTWRKVQADWEAWCHRSLADEDVVRLILDGTVVRARLDRRATSISLLVVLGIRRDGQKVLLAVRNMGSENEAAWRSLLDDLVSRGLPAPNFVIIDGAAGLEKALGLLVRCVGTALHRAQAPQPNLPVSEAEVSLVAGMLDGVIDQILDPDRTD